MEISQPSLRPLDMVVALFLAVHPETGYEELAKILGVGLGSGHRSVKRLEAAGLVLPHRRAISIGPVLEFLQHGIRFAFYPVLGPEAPGIPTAYSAPPMADHIVSDRALVWPSADGEVRGDSLLPLYDGAPGLAKRDPAVYHLLTLADAIRVGRVRERKMAVQLTEEALRRDGPR